MKRFIYGTRRTIYMQTTIHRKRRMMDFPGEAQRVREQHKIGSLVERIESDRKFNIKLDP